MTAIPELLIRISAGAGTVSASLDGIASDEDVERLAVWISGDPARAGQVLGALAIPYYRGDLDSDVEALVESVLERSRPIT